MSVVGCGNEVKAGAMARKTDIDLVVVSVLDSPLARLNARCRRMARARFILSFKENQL